MDNTFRRLVTAAAFSNLFAYAFAMAVVEASINEIGRAYRASTSLLGWLFLVFMVGFFFAMILGGRHADKHRKLPAMLASCFMIAAGAGIFAWAPSFPIALLAMLLIGAGGGLGEGLSVAVISDIYPNDRRTAMLNSSQVMFAIGSVLGPSVIHISLRAGITWRMGLVATIIVSLLSALITYLGIATRRERPIGHDHQIGHWREVARDPLVFWLAIGILLYVGQEMGQASWLAAYFKRDLAASAPTAASSVSLFWAGIGCGRIVATRVSRHLSDAALISWSLALGMIAQTMLLLARGEVSGFVSTALLGFCLGPVWPTIMSRAAAAHPRQAGTVIGIVASAGCLGGGIFPAVIGYAAVGAGMRAALWICFAAVVVNLVIFVGLVRRRGES